MNIRRPLFGQPWRRCQPLAIIQIFFIDTIQSCLSFQRVDAEIVSIELAIHAVIMPGDVREHSGWRRPLNEPVMRQRHRNVNIYTSLVLSTVYRSCHSSNANSGSMLACCQRYSWRVLSLEWSCRYYKSLDHPP